MKKRILALVSATILVFAMNMSVMAAGSPNASATAGSVVDKVAKEELATGTQQFTESTIAKFATETTVETTVAGATVAAASVDTAKAAISQAKNLYGEKSFVASIVELNVPAGTGAATFTLKCPNVWAGQTVKILHQLSNGTWEVITPSAVGNNYVTFTMTSYSPVAIVIDTGATAPQTADVVMLVAAMAVILLAGACVASKKIAR